MTLLDPPIMGEDVKSGLPVLMIGVDLAGSSCTFITVDIEGLLKLQDVSELKADWRYDMRKRQWYDAAEGPTKDA